MAFFKSQEGCISRKRKRGLQGTHTLQCIRALPASYGDAQAQRTELRSSPMSSISAIHKKQISVNSKLEVIMPLKLCPSFCLTHRVPDLFPHPNCSGKEARTLNLRQPLPPLGPGPSGHRKGKGGQSFRSRQLRQLVLLVPHYGSAVWSRDRTVTPRLFPPPSKRPPLPRNEHPSNSTPSTRQPGVCLHLEPQFHS